MVSVLQTDHPPWVGQNMTITSTSEVEPMDVGTSPPCIGQKFYVLLKNAYQGPQRLNLINDNMLFSNEENRSFLYLYTSTVDTASRHDVRISSKMIDHISYFRGEDDVPPGMVIRLKPKGGLKLACDLATDQLIKMKMGSTEIKKNVADPHCMLILILCSFSEYERDMLIHEISSNKLVSASKMTEYFNRWQTALFPIFSDVERKAKNAKQPIVEELSVQNWINILHLHTIDFKNTSGAPDPSKNLGNLALRSKGVQAGTLNGKSDAEHQSNGVSLVASSSHQQSYTTIYKATDVVGGLKSLNLQSSPNTNKYLQNLVGGDVEKRKSPRVLPTPRPPSKILLHQKVRDLKSGALGDNTELGPSKPKRLCDSQTVTLDEDDDDTPNIAKLNIMDMKPTVYSTNKDYHYRPGNSGRSAATLHFDDIGKLALGEMLNDKLIAFHIQYTLNELCKSEMQDRVHVFETFFFSRLIENAPKYLFKDEGIRALNKKKPVKNAAKMAVGRFNMVKHNFDKSCKRWTRKIDIFAKDYLVIPVNDDGHWYAVIVVHPGKAIKNEKLSDEDLQKNRLPGVRTNSNPKAQLVMLDSLMDASCPRRALLPDIVKDYLECELEDKKKTPGCFDRLEMGTVIPKRIPRQQNYIDCGVFLAAFVESFLLTPPHNDELTNNNFDWTSQYPGFDLKMEFMRDKMLKLAHGKVIKKDWSQLLQYEQRCGKGATVLDEKSQMDHVRRPRRYSFSGRTKDRRFEVRSLSEPPTRELKPAATNSAWPHPH